ncbi:MAG: hypothetical protein HY721_06465, partial [Planctomycetes bacterium]|nr:hypothetical protein [Planctomycetota bacterium]
MIVLSFPEGEGPLERGFSGSLSVKGGIQMVCRCPSFVACAVFVGFAVTGRAGAGETFAQVPEGFLASDRFEFPTNQFLGGLTYSPDGHPLVYIGNELLLYGPGEPKVLTSFDTRVFGSFVVLSPDEKAVIFGE